MAFISQIPLQQGRHIRWSYFVYGLNAKALSQLFPASAELYSSYPRGRLGFVTLKTTLCPNFYGTNLGL